jgi:hypothetical protein
MLVAVPSAKPPARALRSAGWSDSGLNMANFMQRRSVRDCRFNRWDANLFQFTGCPSLRRTIALTDDQAVFVNHVLDVPPHFLLGECFHFWLSFAFVSLRRDFDRGLN